RRGPPTSWAWGGCWLQSWFLVPVLVLPGGEQRVELVLVFVVSEEVVQLGAGLQPVDNVLLCALAAQRFVEMQCGLVHGPVRTTAIQRDVDARAAELIGGEERRGAELGEVGQDRHLHRLAETAVVFQ